jgi:hypothetical protein
VGGDVTILVRLAATIVEFDPRFEIMPGAKARGDVAAVQPHGAKFGKVVAE